MRWVRAKIVFIFLVCGTSLWLGPVMASPPVLTADKPIEFDRDTQALTAHGNVQLRQDGFALQADHLRYFKDSQKVEARDHVEFMSGKTRVLCPSADYWVERREVFVPKVNLGANQTCLSGARLTGNPKGFEINRATTYFSEPDMGAFNIKAKKITLVPNESIAFHNAWFRVGKVPFFYLPYYKHSLQESRLKVNVDWGKESRFGRFARSDIAYKTGNPDYTIGALLDYYAQRGWLYGPTFAYETNQTELWMKGDTKFGHIHDHGDMERGTDILNRPIPQNRYFFLWGHNQEIKNKVDVTAHVSYWKDSEVLRDYRPTWFGFNQNPDNFAECVYRGNNYLLSAFTRLRVHDFQTVQQRLPELRFDLMPSALGESGIYQNAYASLAHLSELKRADDPTPNPHTCRGDFYYGLTRPVDLNPWCAFTPVMGTRVTSYSNPRTNANSYTRFLGQVGFDMEVKSFAEWSYQNKRWDINGLRHSCKPILQYRFIPDAERGNGAIPVIDRYANGTQLPLIDLGQMRNTDQMNSLHVVRLGLQNALLTRATKYGSRELLFLNVYEDLNMRRAAFPRRWSDLFTELGTSPAPWISASVYQRLDPTRFSVQELGTNLSLINAKEWKFSVGTSYWKRETLQYNSKLEYAFTSRHSLEGLWRWDGRTHRMVEQTYSFKVRVGTNWFVSYDFGYKLDRYSADSHFNFNIRFTILGL